MPKDLYSILGIERNASEADIKRTYRKLAQKYHPDVNKNNPEAEQKFKEINVAYEILSDPKKRTQYDQFGFTGSGGGGGSGGFGGFEGFEGFDPSSFGGGFSDIFETFFGGGAGAGHGGGRSKRRGPTPGADIESVLTLNFEESIFGCEKELEINKADACTACHGKGMEPGTSLKSCSECGGAGQIRSVRQTILGQIQTMRPCSACHGEGQIPEKPCRTCHAQMRTRQKSRVTVKIPAGIENGATIRLKGKGEAGIRGGDYGDLYLHIQVKSHAQFERHGMDIHANHTLHVLQAVIGAEVEVPTVHGPVTLKIPPGTQSGQTFKVKGKGAPSLRNGTLGDHYIKVHLDIPKKLSRREKELYAALAKEAGLRLPPGGNWFTIGS